MSISLYFGLPGCGKTTLMAAIAIDAIKSKKYKNIYCNVRLTIPGVTYIPNDAIGKYGLFDALILIDEATLFADSRDFKSFDQGKKTFFLLHRHFRSNIILFLQQWNALDLKIRTITDKVYYVYKPPLLGKWFTRYYQIPYGIIIPEEGKHGSSSKLGEIIQGYCKPPLLVRLFCPIFFRPKFYKYFDSWEIPPGFPPLPIQYKPYSD